MLVATGMHIKYTNDWESRLAFGGGKLAKMRSKRGLSGARASAACVRSPLCAICSVRTAILRPTHPHPLLQRPLVVQIRRHHSQERITRALYRTSNLTLTAAICAACTRLRSCVCAA